MMLLKLGLELFSVYEVALQRGASSISSSELRMATYALEKIFQHREQSLKPQRLTDLSVSRDIFYGLAALRAAINDLDTPSADFGRLRSRLKLFNRSLSSYIKHDPVPSPALISSDDALRIPRVILSRLRSERGLADSRT